MIFGKMRLLAAALVQPQNPVGKALLLMDWVRQGFL